MIYTHSHGDHFGGVKGVTSEADVSAGKVQVLAPAGFTEAVASEIMLAGSAMSRRVHISNSASSCRPVRAAMSIPASARQSVARQSA